MSPIARRGLPGDAAGWPDDVPQPWTKAGAIRGGDGNRRKLDEETIMMPAWCLRRPNGIDEAEIEQLAGVLIDCVEGGASVSFMHPLTRERAVAFWRQVAEGVRAGERVLL